MKNLAFCLFCVFVLCFTGCGAKTVTVSGKVIFDGEPGQNIAVLFQAQSTESGTPETAFGITNAKGEYTLSLLNSKKGGAMPGEYSVFISWKDPHPDLNREEGDMTSNCPYKIPTRAGNGEMMFTIPPEGTKDANFEFDSAKESFAPSGV